jgi:hypothetical protein
MKMHTGNINIFEHIHSAMQINKRHYKQIISRRNKYGGLNFVTIPDEEGMSNMRRCGMVPGLKYSGTPF